MFYTQKGWRIHLPVCFHFIFMFRSQTYTEWEKMVGGHALVLKLTFTHTILLCQREMEVFFAFAHFFSPLSLWHSFSSSHIYLSSAALFTFSVGFCVCSPSGYNCKHLAFFSGLVYAWTDFSFHALWIFNVLLLRFLCKNCKQKKSSCFFSLFYGVCRISVSKFLCEHIHAMHIAHTPICHPWAMYASIFPLTKPNAIRTKKRAVSISWWWNVAW